MNQLLFPLKWQTQSGSMDRQSGRWPKT